MPTGLPDVEVIFAPGAQFPTAAQSGNVDALIAPCVLGRVGTVYGIADASTITTLLGYGVGGEMAGQVLNQSSSTIYVVPATYDAGTIGSVSASRAAAPTVTPDSMIGQPGAPLAPSSANTGNGQATFDATSFPEAKGSSYTSLEVDITGAGIPGTATMNVKVGGVTVASGVTVPSTPYTVPDPVSGNSTLVLAFSVPASGSFRVGDVFTAIPSVNDGYNVLLQILSVAANGIATFQVSLDGGATYLPGIYNATLGGNVTSSGATAPTLTLSGTPSGSHTVAITFTRSGVAGLTDGSSVDAQAGTNAGFLYNSTSPGAAHGTAKISTPASGLTKKVALVLSGTGTAAGSANTAAPTTGTGTAAGTLTIDGRDIVFAGGHFPATYTDTPTGIVVTFDTSTNNLTNSDHYTNSGLLTNGNQSGLGSSAVCAITTATTGAVAVPVSLTVTAAGTAAGTASDGGATTGTGTATGTLVIGSNSWTFDTPGGGGGTGGMPATFTDSTTGIVVKIATGAGNLETSGSNHDVYTVTVQPVAQFQYVLDGGAAVTGQVIPDNGSYTALHAATGVNIAFPNTNADRYTYDGTTASNTTKYSYNLYAPYIFAPKEADGSYVGLAIEFGFGTYQTSDTYSFLCTPPSLSSANVQTAISTLLAAESVSFRRVAIVASPATAAATATIASAVQTQLTTAAQSPTWLFASAIVFGPDKTAATSGCTPQDFINAFALLAQDRISNVTGGADVIQSVLTSRQDTRNCGFGIFPRMVSVSIATDPGNMGLGALANVISTTTSTNDATTLWQNRITTTRRFRQTPAGVYCSGAVSLAQAGTLYGTSVYMWIRDLLGTLSRAFSLQFINAGVATVTSNGVTTLDPSTASDMNRNVGNLISNIMVPGLVQKVTIAFSTTAPLNSSAPNLPMSANATVFDIIRYITDTVSVSL